MIIRLIGLVVVLVTSINLFAQKDPVKFGDIPMEDLQMKVYDKDSSASAVVLADYGQSSIGYQNEKGFVINYERIVRIKILTKDGLDWGSFRFLLYRADSGDKEKLSGLKGVTYNLENGKVVETKLKDDGIFKDKLDDHHDEVKVTLPNVKEGSVIEITYRILSDFLFNFQDWSFQSRIPVRLSEYRAKIPEYFVYEKYLQGYVPLAVNDAVKGTGSWTVVFRDDDPRRMGDSKLSSEKFDFTETKFRWVAEHVPAFRTEPYMTTYEDYVSKINFELALTNIPGNHEKRYMGTWEDINRMYADDERYGLQVTGNDYLRKTVNELLTGVTSTDEKIGILHQYVRNNFLWDEKTRRYITNDNLRKVFDDKKGNSTEINLVLASMLEKAGIEVYPVLISTRDNGFVREATPVSSQFNNTICMARSGEKVVLLDATRKLLPVGVLPENCLNGKGFVVSKAGYSWVELKAPKSRETVTLDVTLSGDGGLKGKITLDFTGYFAEKNRTNYFSKGEGEYVKMSIPHEHVLVTKSNFENAKELTSTFRETHEVEMSEQATLAGNTIYLTPLAMWRISENPFKLEKREYPVDFGSPFDKVHSVKIVIPDGYVVEELPQSKAIALPNGMAKFLFNTSQLGNTINVISNFQINRAMYVPQEYDALRELYAQAVAKHAEQIVLKKK